MDGSISQYGRNYVDGVEKERGFKIFKDNVEFIDKFNNEGNRTYKLSVNEFTDLTNEEFVASHTGYKIPTQPTSSKTTTFKYDSLTKVPTSMDWRDKGVVTPIKYQRQCGGNNHGCSGGWMEDAFSYILQNQGIATEENYPYQAMEGSCDQERASNYAARITSFEDVTPNSEEALLQAVATQPISVAIDASSLAFQHYSMGVYNGECGTQMTHAVTVIGYGINDDGTKYWLIKNSWGTTWGENGYMRIQRDFEYQQGLCGIAIRPSYPVIA
ncbi:senescence-specific cysteine protease sag12 [Fagus crenata]